MQLKIAYSVHRDLNVKGNNERSRDYTLPEPSASFAGAAMQPGAAFGADAYMGTMNGMSSGGTNLHITGSFSLKCCAKAVGVWRSCIPSFEHCLCEHSPSREAENPSRQRIYGICRLQHDSIMKA